MEFCIAHYHKEQQCQIGEIIVLLYLDFHLISYLFGPAGQMLGYDSVNDEFLNYQNEAKYNIRQSTT